MNDEEYYKINEAQVTGQSGHYLIFNTVMVVTMCRVENEWKQTTLYTKGN